MNMGAIYHELDDPSLAIPTKEKSLLSAAIICQMLLNCYQIIPSPSLIHSEVLISLSICNLSQHSSPSSSSYMLSAVLDDIFSEPLGCPNEGWAFSVTFRALATSSLFIAATHYRKKLLFQAWRKHWELRVSIYLEGNLTTCPFNKALVDIELAELEKGVSRHIISLAVDFWQDL